MAAADALSVQVMHKVAQLGNRRVGKCPGRAAEGGDGQAEGRAGQCGSWPAGPGHGWNRAQARTSGAHAYRSARMHRTAFTGRDLTQIVGRAEVEGLVGTSPDRLGAGLPYG